MLKNIVDKIEEYWQKNIAQCFGQPWTRCSFYYRVHEVLSRFIIILTSYSLFKVSALY